MQYVSSWLAAYLPDVVARVTMTLNGASLEAVGRDALGASLSPQAPANNVVAATAQIKRTLQGMVHDT
jgi:hypothetical protein